ncbi:hypothetical protein MUN84_18625 [Hymenobacter sp. 5516J-16]|uniref:hypothetical protein n=1 Tax=Hymenobacter sp. 5516J-16 TaxID=2932253 RepID=UPI001FD2DFBD|nr:hypothetical protein [Hymenobacter sp. 5516J-16]UOQ76529.1 hypothetical protein MUN84_18625 [Hymenobacter sp. 5516J-16]
MYICLEGLKGCGKSTLLTSAQQLLATHSVPFDLVAPTNSAPLEHSWTERLSAWLPCLRRLDAWNEHLYAERSRYATDAGQWQRPLILGDRSIVTSYATRWYKWGNPKRCVERVNTLEAHLPAPDHIILLDLTPQQAWARARTRGAPTVSTTKPCLACTKPGRLTSKFSGSAFRGCATPSGTCSMPARLPMPCSATGSD